MVGKRFNLVIKLPNGEERNYSSGWTKARKAVAKTNAIKNAIDDGVIDWIEGRNEVGAIAKSPSSVVAVTSPSKALDELLECCKIWRKDRVAPHFIVTKDDARQREKDVHFDPSTIAAEAYSLVVGCILEIKLSDTIWKAWSVEAQFRLPSDAKEEVLLLALSEGALDFVRHGDGQKTPGEITTTPKPSAAISQESALPSVVHGPRRSTVLLQDWVQSFPHALPHNVGVDRGNETPQCWLQNYCKPKKGGATVGLHFTFTRGENISRE